MNLLIKEFNKIKEFYKLGKDVQLKDALVLLKACKSFDYKKGELLLKQGTKENNIYFITKGLVRCFNINEKGEERFYCKSSKDIKHAAELGIKIGENLKKQSKGSYKK